MTWHSVFLSNPRLYYRVQPAGLGLAHTSEGSEERLPQGFVFAYASPDEIVSAEAWSWIRQEAVESPLEVVEFFGGSEFDPGDWEGVAVKPTTLRRRQPLAVWLRAHRFDEEASEVSR